MYWQNRSFALPRTALYETIYLNAKVYDYSYWESNLNQADIVQTWTFKGHVLMFYLGARAIGVTAPPTTNIIWTIDITWHKYYYVNYYENKM